MHSKAILFNDLVFTHILNRTTGRFKQLVQTNDLFNFTPRAKPGR